MGANRLSARATLAATIGEWITGTPIGSTKYGMDVSADGRRNQTILFAAISAASSGANVVVAASAGNKIKVLSYTIIADAAVTAKWQSGSTDLTGAMSLATNGGVATPIGSPGHGWILETAVGAALNLNIGSAVGIRGHLSYFLEA